MFFDSEICSKCRLRHKHTSTAMAKLKAMIVDSKNETSNREKIKMSKSPTNFSLCLKILQKRSRKKRKRRKKKQKKYLQSLKHTFPVFFIKMPFFINLLLKTATQTVRQSVTTIITTKEINNNKNTSNNIDSNVKNNNSIKFSTTMQEQEKSLANDTIKNIFTTFYTVPIMILLILSLILLHIQYVNCQTQQTKLSQQEHEQQPHAQSELLLENKAQIATIAHDTRKTIYAIRKLIYFTGRSDKQKTATTSIDWSNSNSSSNASVRQFNEKNNQNIYVSNNGTLSDNQMLLLPRHIKKVLKSKYPMAIINKIEHQLNYQQSNMKNDNSEQNSEEFTEKHIKKNAIKTSHETKNITNFKQFSNSLIVSKQLFHNRNIVFENNKIKKLYNDESIINFQTYFNKKNKNYNTKKMNNATLYKDNTKNNNDMDKFIMIHQHIVNDYINKRSDGKYISDARRNTNDSGGNKFINNNLKMYTYYNGSVNSNNYYNGDGKEHYYKYNTSSALYVVIDNTSTKEHINRNNNYNGEKFITNQNYTYTVVNSSSNNNNVNKFYNYNDNDDDGVGDDVNTFIAERVGEIRKEHDDLSLDSDSDIDEDFYNNLDNAQPNRFASSEDKQKLMHLVMNGLGLQQLPNMAKVNISQQEYLTKYREYLERVSQRKRLELSMNEAKWKLNVSRVTRDVNTKDSSLHILSIMNNASFKMIKQHTSRNMYYSKKEHRRKRDSFYAFRDLSPTLQNTQIFTSSFSGKNTHSRRSIGNGKKSSFAESEKTNILLHFPLEEVMKTNRLHADDLEEANIRLMLIQSSALAWKHNRFKRKRRKKRKFLCDEEDDKIERSSNNTIENKHVSRKQKHVINLKVYQRLAQGRRVWMDGHKIEIMMDRVESRVNAPSTDETHSRWLQFDVTKAVEVWLRESTSNLGLELQCDNCQRVGARILSDMSLSRNSQKDQDTDYNNDNNFQLEPVLNIIGRLSGSLAQRNMPSKDFDNANNYHHNYQQQQSSLEIVNNCRNSDFQRCCRHTMEVVFKEIKGFEFILQPKVFDAGYCHGRCPPRYNPAHHHAMLQSLIWKQSRKRAPRPCCAPSKLVELEVLHVDEKDTEKLKISTWTDMRVIECACS